MAEQLNWTELISYDPFCFLWDYLLGERDNHYTTETRLVGLFVTSLFKIFVFIDLGLDESG